MLGICAALGATIAWTLASSLWKSQANNVKPIQLNIIKTSLATIIFLPVLVTLPWKLQSASIGILCLSGCIGIAIGDTFYFSALKLIGTRKTLTIESLSPLIAVFLGVFTLGEKASIRVLIGAVFVTASLFLISQEKPIKNVTYLVHNRLVDKLGFLYAFGAIVCGVIGALLSRSVLILGDLTPIQSSSIRLLGAFFSLLFLSPLFKDLNWSLIQRNQLNFSLITFTTFLGTNTAIFLQQLVFQKLSVGLAVTIFSTAPVMALFIAKREGDNFGKTGILAAFMSLFGVLLAIY